MSPLPPVVYLSLPTEASAQRDTGHIIELWLAYPILTKPDAAFFSLSQLLLFEKGATSGMVTAAQSDSDAGHKTY